MTATDVLALYEVFGPSVVVATVLLLLFAAYWWMRQKDAARMQVEFNRLDALRTEMERRLTAEIEHLRRREKDLEHKLAEFRAENLTLRDDLARLKRDLDEIADARKQDEVEP